MQTFKITFKNAQYTKDIEAERIEIHDSPVDDIFIFYNDKDEKIAFIPRSNVKHIIMQS